MQTVREISVQELKKWIDSGEAYQIVDVRELNEVQAANLGGLHIPVSDILKRRAEINPDMRTALLCRSGRRSEMAAYQLQAIGYTNLFNVRGGIVAYAREIDNSLRPI